MDEKTMRLVEAAAKAIPFIGYSAHVPEIENELIEAIKEASGVDWYLISEEIDRRNSS